MGKRTLLVFLIILNLTLLSRALSYGRLDDLLLNPLVGKPTTYIVREHNNLYKIARQLDVAYRHIQRANQTEAYRVKPGQKLIIPTFRVAPRKSAEGIILNLPEMTIYFYQDGKVQDFFPVTIGRLSMRTPQGKFRITYKKLHPTWFPPEWAGIEKPVPPGPRNPLGDRAMILSIHGYLIHSTNAPWSIGKPVSHGCIRMYPPDAKKLFKLVRVGTPVEIIYQPIKLGFDQGKIYLEVYPDVYYHGTNTFKKVSNLLEEKGILPLVEEEKIKAILKAALGIPVPILGSDIKVVVDGEVIPLEISLIIKDGQALVELEKVAQSLDANLIWDEVRKRVIVSRYWNVVELEINPQRKVFLNGQEVPSDNFPLFNLLGKTIVPLRFIANALGSSVWYDKEEQTIHLFSPGR
ncbi:MAG: hypothetical protein COS84_09355 [Armatimonadetes bacterium CG07_land_8_20_14_0_80_40_9]|nr:MAG: hypothetical protein COS84_09355 [Armatimonadetes bacterium CG07_land_8_20_14_0_80_40_9]